MSDDMVYVISDIDQFVDETRKIVFGAFGKPDLNENNSEDFIEELADIDKQELDATLTHAECMAILHTHIKPRKTKKGKIKYLISDEAFSMIIEDFNARLVSNLLSQLVKDGIVESSYDEEANDFIFWVKEEYKNNDKKED